MSEIINANFISANLIFAPRLSENKQIYELFHSILIISMIKIVPTIIQLSSELSSVTVISYYAALRYPINYGVKGKQENTYRNKAERCLIIGKNICCKYANGPKCRNDKKAN